MTMSYDKYTLMALFVMLNKVVVWPWPTKTVFNVHDFSQMLLWLCFYMGWFNEMNLQMFNGVYISHDSKRVFKDQVFYSFSGHALNLWL